MYTNHLLLHKIAVMSQMTIDRGLALAIQLQQSGRGAEAESIYRQLLQQHPNHALALHDLGTLLYYTGRAEDALGCWRRALAIQPSLAEAHYNIANIWRDRGLMDEAIASYRQAIALRPDFAPAWTNLANALRAVALIDDAMAAYRKAIELDPDPRIASSMIFSMHFQSDIPPRQIFEECAKWNARYALPLMPQALHFDNERSTQKRLRIGYISPDFRRHSQSQFTIPLLSGHEHDRFEVFCYSDVITPDSLTQRITSFADTWRETARLDHPQLADLIRSDRIDILVDLTMHMDRNRLLTFARKPAPIQVTWLAYPGTTGLTAIDYRLSDPYLDPPSEDGGLSGTNDSYSETTFRLPETFWCYDPLETDLPVNSLPAAMNEFITFGCLNNFSKVNDVTLDLWARVMKAVEQSRLLLLAPPGASRSRVIERLGNHGIAAARINFVDRQPREQYLQTYHRIDICLDTTPCNGHTTMMDALWMGAPSVTLSGPTAISRGGASILSNVGLNHLIAKTEEQYIHAATSLCQNLDTLAQLRASLRQKLELSPLMDADGFARDMENVYREIWRRWCERPL